MVDRIRQKLSYANVMVTILAVIVLGGGAIAVAGSNTKTTKKIVRRLAPTLSVNHAKSADSAANASHAADSDQLGGFPGSAYERPACPAGTELVDAACIETAQRGPDTWNNADSACYAAQRRLPTVAELESLRFSSGTDFGIPGEWTSDVWVDANGMTSTSYVRIVGVNSAGTVFFTAASNARGFRCVVPVP